MNKLYLGVSRQIITPSVGGRLFGYSPDIISERTEDDLTVTAFFFSQGSKQSLMISLTLCLIQNKLSDRISEMIESKFSISKQNCMISATHTHSGPDTAGMIGWGDMDEDYIENVLIRRIMQSVEDAIQSKQSVTVGYACGNCLACVNRREIKADNRVVLGQNPEGSFDPTMTVISFKNEAGEKVANIIHYAGHGTCAGANREISRDWHGVMTDMLESYSGAFTAFFNGADGDIGPRLSTGKTLSEGEIKYIYETGNIAGNDAVRIFKKIVDYREVELACGGGEIPISLKKRISFEQAKEIYKKFSENSINYQAAIKNFAKRVIDSYENGESDSDEMMIEQTIIALGNIVFVSFPFELFSYIGICINSEYIDKIILPLSHTNGSMGYFITEDAKEGGGYEVDMFNYGEKTQQYSDNAYLDLIKNSVKHINDVLHKGEE